MGTTSQTEASRRRVLDAAMVEIGSRGLGGLRLVDVARGAEVSVGFVQHHFRNREGLLWEALFEALRQSVEALEEAGDGVADPHLRLRLYVKTVLDSPRWPLWLEFWGAAFRFEKVREAHKTQYQVWTAPFEKTIEEGLSAGVFNASAPARDIADRLTALLDGLAVRMLVGDPLITKERAIDLATQWIDDELVT